MAGPTALKPGEAAKKETAKVSVTPPAKAAVPQATVKLTQDAPAKPAPAIKTKAEDKTASTAEAPDQLTGVLAIAAAVVALAAFGIQIWTYL